MPKQHHDHEVIEIGKPGAKGVALAERVHALPARIKKVTVSDDGKLLLALETEGLSDESLASIRDMLVLQQSGPVFVDMSPAQRDLFDA